MLSIIIPAFNSEKTLSKLLDSIRCSDFSDYEVVVVDDSSADNTASIIRNYKGIRGVFLSVHSGPSIARNKGAEEAKGEVLVFFDSDVEIEPDTLSKIVRRFQENPAIKVLSGTYSDEPLNQEFFPRFKALWFKSLFMDTQDITDSLEGFCLAIDRELFKSSGGFDPIYKTSSIEDYEFGCRIRRRHPIYFDSSIQVRHHFPGFWENARLFLRRAYDFIPFFLSQKNSQRGLTLNRAGLASLCAFAGTLLFIPAFIYPYAAWGFLFFSILFSFFALRLLRLVFSQEGFCFTLYSFIAYYFSAAIAGLGIFLGTLKYTCRVRVFGLRK